MEIIFIFQFQDPCCSSHDSVLAPRPCQLLNLLPNRSVAACLGVSAILTACGAHAVGCPNGAFALAQSGVPSPDNVANSTENRQAGIGLPLSVLRAGAEEEKRAKEDAAVTPSRQASSSGSTAVASQTLHSTMLGGNSVTGTKVTPGEAVVPTGGDGA
jgi:hypothetical protein